MAPGAGRPFPLRLSFRIFIISALGWGPGDHKSTQVLASYLTYALPLGRDRKFGKDMNPVLNAIVGDWQVNTILSLHTRFPLTISAGEASGTNSRGSGAPGPCPVLDCGE